MPDSEKPELRIVPPNDGTLDEPESTHILTESAANIHGTVAAETDKGYAAQGLFAEKPASVYAIPSHKLKNTSRRDFLIAGVGAVAVASGFWWLLPTDTKQRITSAGTNAKLDTLEARIGLTPGAQSAVLGRVLTFDDDVAAALYSPTRTVPIYSKSDVTPHLVNNYDGQTPDPGYIPNWNLTITGLESEKLVKLTANDLTGGFSHHEQITRLVCVEGWSAIAWWGGIRFADLLAAYPPMRGARWAQLWSDVNLDSDGNSDPYYVSIDLGTARHPQSLLATHRNAKPLTVDYGAPVRLLVPMKLGLKNIKAVTKIEYTVAQPADYWNDRGYSKYDGL